MDGYIARGLSRAHETQEQVRINVLDAPAPERIGTPAFIEHWHKSRGRPNVIVEVIVQCTGHVHCATVKALNKVQGQF